MLGYRPSRAFDGKFHRVSVKVKRSGIDVRARRGYVATPRPAVPTDLAAPKESPVPKQSLPPKESVGPELADTIDPVLPTAIHPGARDNQRPPAGAASSPPAVPTNTAAAAGTELRVRPLASEHTAALAEGNVSSNAQTRGWEAYQRGDVEGARAALAPLADRSDTPSWVHYALGQADYALARYREAIVQWESVRLSEPDFEPVYFDLVDGYLQVKDRARAADVLSSAQLFWPSDPDVYNALGVVHTGAGAIDEAIKAFGAAIDAAPKEPVSYLNLAIALEKRYAKSLRYFAPTRAYIGNEKDRQDAIANYRKYPGIRRPIRRNRAPPARWPDVGGHEEALATRRSVVAAASPPRFDFSALLLGIEAPFTRRLTGPRRPAFLWAFCGVLEQRDQARARGLSILRLPTMLPAVNHQHIVGGDPVTRERSEALFDVGRQG